MSFRGNLQYLRVDSELQRLQFIERPSTLNAQKSFLSNHGNRHRDSSALDFFNRA